MIVRVYIDLRTKKGKRILKYLDREQVLLPKKSLLERTKRELERGEYYVLKDGETLSSILENEENL